MVIIAFKMPPQQACLGEKISHINNNSWFIAEIIRTVFCHASVLVL